MNNFKTYIVNEMYEGNGSEIIKEHLKHLIHEITEDNILNLLIKADDFKYEYNQFAKEKTYLDDEAVLNLINKQVYIYYTYLKHDDFNIYEINDYLAKHLIGFKYQLSLISDDEESVNELYIYDEDHHGLVEYQEIDKLDHGNWHMLDNLFCYESNPAVKDDAKIVELIQKLAPYVRIDVTNYYESQIFDVVGDVVLNYQDLIKMFDILAEILHLIYQNSEYEFIDFVYSNLDCNNFELLRVTFEFNTATYLIEKSM